MDPLTKDPTPLPPSTKVSVRRLIRSAQNNKAKNTAPKQNGVGSVCGERVSRQTVRVQTGGSPCQSSGDVGLNEGGHRLNVTQTQTSMLGKAEIRRRRKHKKKKTYSKLELCFSTASHLCNSSCYRTRQRLGDSCTQGARHFVSHQFRGLTLATTHQLDPSASLHWLHGRQTRGTYHQVRVCEGAGIGINAVLDS